MISEHHYDDEGHKHHDHDNHDHEDCHDDDVDQNHDHDGSHEWQNCGTMLLPPALLISCTAAVPT